MPELNQPDDLAVDKRRLHDSPAVSVIVPAYKVTQYIGECLDSVIGQTFQNFEIIVVNDGCPDTENLEKVLSRYRDRIIYCKQANQGLSSARNTGIRAASAPLIALLDSDDAWEPNYLEVQVSKMRADPTIDVLYPNGVIFGNTCWSGTKTMDLSPSNGPVTVESLLRCECSVLVSVTASKDAMVKAGLFDPTLRSVEDFDLWVRMAKMGFRFAYHQTPLLRYRRRNDSLSADPVWMHRNVLIVFDKFGKTLDLTEQERLCLAEVTQHRRALLDMELGMRALASRNWEEARGYLRGAKRDLRGMRSLKLASLLVLMRVAPGITAQLAGKWLARQRA